MHKVLKPTELRGLRELGFEVFNPAYLSPVYDQSADLTIDLDQPTTLPPDVFRKLIAYDFFYRPIDDEIAEVLNTYFDVVIVTINVDWLMQFAKVYRGRLIYRVFGQHYLLSDVIVGSNAWALLHDRPGFTIVPFAAETIVNEHRWFVDLVQEIVPYQIPDDVFDHPARWEPGPRERIATIFPNVENPYYGAAYGSFAPRFPESFFQIYGPQRSHPADKRFVGALSRPRYLESLCEAAGFYYDYRDSVCYLPPIESMQLGVPVVCAKGSLLATFLGRSAPNVAADDEDARAKVIGLVRGDRSLADDLLAAQDETRSRYDRAVVRPLFDAAFKRLLATDKGDGSDRAPPPPAITTRPSRGKIVVPLHVDGLFRHRYGRVYAFEGIPRVVDSIVRILSSGSDVHFVVSCTAASLEILHDFFLQEIKAGIVELVVVGDPSRTDGVQHAIDRMSFLEMLNADETISTVLIPHYYLFPELLGLRHRSVLYLPDYFPHLSPGEVFDVSAEKDQLNKEVGVAHAKGADVVLTNSGYTKRYLVEAGFVTTATLDKVLVAPLPFLGAGRAVDLNDDERRIVEDEIGCREFLFYPTANRPNKRLDFLFDVYAMLLRKRPGLALVLTCGLHTYEPARRKAEALGLTERIIFLHHVPEGVLRWLYANCRAMCLTSILEGNFPPQVLEAIGYRAPVVATRLSTITEILGDREADLLLCKELNLDDFVDKIERAFTERDEVLARQDEIAEYLKAWNSKDAFLTSLRIAFPEVVSAGKRT